MIFLLPLARLADGFLVSLVSLMLVAPRSEELIPPSLSSHPASHRVIINVSVAFLDVADEDHFYSYACKSPSRAIRKAPTCPPPPLSKLASHCSALARLASPFVTLR